MKKPTFLVASIATMSLTLVLAGIAPASAASIQHESAAMAATTGPTTGSAILSMWAWGNSVDPAVDARGLGQPEMAPAKIAAFAAAHKLTSVYLSAPWASNQGAIQPWLSASVKALHAKGIKVSALGGDPGWIDQPSLAAQWISDARAAASFDAIQLDIEPWVGQTDPDFTVITDGYLALLAAAQTAAGPLAVGADLPWWLTTKSYGTGTSFDALVAAVDTVAIVTFADHAIGSDGIVALATPAVTAASAAGKLFTIGVETDTPEIAGGAQFTFFDEGSAVLETQTAKVRTLFTSKVGYRGVTVEHKLAWENLIAAT